MCNDKQECFCQEYILDLNATQAAIRAGYSAKTADTQGPRLLENVGVRARIDELKAERMVRTQVDADWVIMNLTEVAGRCLQRRPVMVYDRAEKAMVQAQDADDNHLWTFDSGGANRALEILGKHIPGFFAADKHEVTGKDGGPMELKLEDARTTLDAKLAGLAARVGTEGVPGLTDTSGDTGSQ